MTGEACTETAPDNSAASHCYYVRMPKGEMLPQQWIDKAETVDGWELFTTCPVAVSEMHAFMAGRKDAFFAGIQQA